MSPARQKVLQEDFERATNRLEKLIGELHVIGVELKDPSRALLDFPAMHEGREVLLCWMADEETITHWHEIQAGFAGRQARHITEGIETESELRNQQFGSILPTSRLSFLPTSFIFADNAFSSDSFGERNNEHRDQLRPAAPGAMTIPIGGHYAPVPVS